MCSQGWVMRTLFFKDECYDLSGRSSLYFPLNQTDNAVTFPMKWQKDLVSMCSTRGLHTIHTQQHGLVLRNLQGWKEKYKRPSPHPSICLQDYANQHLCYSNVHRLMLKLHSCTASQSQNLASHSCVTSYIQYMLCICQAQKKSYT